MKLNKDQIRQGDVMMVRVTKTENNITPVVPEPGQRVILAHGEVTGHTHALVLRKEAKTPPKVPVFDAAAERYIQLLDDASLTHEEHTAHKPIMGLWEMPVQVEAGVGNMTRRVAD
jgi:hypothetical protein